MIKKRRIPDICKKRGCPSIRDRGRGFFRLKGKRERNLPDQESKERESSKKKR